MHKTVRDMTAAKAAGRKISVITAYDYAMAVLCDGAGVDIMLVGDSAGMVMLGYDSTIPVTMEQMCLFTGAVSRGRTRSMIVSDLPFMSYQSCISDAIANSGRLVRAGCDAVKLEGGAAMAGTVKGIVDVGIPVMGHIGLQPQTTVLADGYRVQARTAQAARTLIRDAEALEAAGAFCIVLEMVGAEAAKAITEAVSVPTIGIGAGAHCDGQVLVCHDMLGMYDRLSPKFVRRYARISDTITQAVRDYVKDVASGSFPAAENSFPMDDGEAGRI